jgi:hypothetical protein
MQDALKRLKKLLAVERVAPSTEPWNVLGRQLRDIGLHSRFRPKAGVASTRVAASAWPTRSTGGASEAQGQGDFRPSPVTS